MSDFRPMNSEELRAAIIAYGEASFACGAWDCNESDESFADTYAVSNAAQDYLFRELGIPADPPGVESILSPADRVRQARVHLRAARDLLRQAGANKALARVRLALSSAEGAQRHADAAPYRQARKEGAR